MKKNDRQLGKPGILYNDTKSTIEALSGVLEGSIAYATDTDELGTYNGSIWEWGTGTVASGGGHTIQDEGVSLTQRSKLNFVGDGVVVIDDAGNDATIVTISGATISGGGTYTDEMAQDAVGGMVNTTLVYDDATPYLGRATISGDVSVLAGSNVSTINEDVVTNAMLATMAAKTLKGNGGVITGNPDDLTLTTVLNWISSTAGAMLFKGITNWTYLAAPTSANDIIGAVYDVVNDFYYPQWKVGTAGYSLQGTASLQATTTDGQTLYWGNIDRVPTTGSGNAKVYIPKTGTVTAAYVWTNSATAGSNENWSVYFRLNDTTDTLIQTVGASTNDRLFSNTGLSISVTAGNYFEIKEVQPTWGTNPANVRRNFAIYIST